MDPIKLSTGSLKVRSTVTLSIAEALTSAGAVLSGFEPSTEFFAPGVPPLKSLLAFQFSAPLQGLRLSIHYWKTWVSKFENR